MDMATGCCSLIRRSILAASCSLLAASAAQAATADSQVQPQAGSPAAQASASASSYQQLRTSLAEIEKGTKLAEFLTNLVNEASRYVDRAAAFVIKDGAAIGWYGRGFDRPEAVKYLSISLAANPAFRRVSSSGGVLRAPLTQSPETAEALRRLGGRPRGMLLAPLLLRGQVRVILYCDTTSEELPAENAAAIEILVLFAATSIDLASLVPPASK
jgi:hypothetical protein